MSGIKKCLRNIFIRMIYGKQAISRSEYIKFIDKLGVRHGENLFITDPLRCEIDLTRPWLLEFGNDVTITDNVRILTHDFSYSVVALKNGVICPSLGKVKIGNNVFLGSHAVILPGTIIGDNCIIGGGTVVTGNIPSNSVVAGVPGRVLSTLDAYEEKLRKLYPGRINLLINEYETVYGKRPSENIMTEFYGLYMTYDQLKEKYPNYINRLVRNPKVIKPIFDNYDSMIDYFEKNTYFPDT